MATVKCVLYRISTDEIINFNYMVSDEFLPPQGLDPDLKVYAYYYPHPEPEFDSRLFILKVTSELVEQPHPVYTTVNQYRVSYSEEKRDIQEMITEVKNAMVQANQLIYNGYNISEVVLKTSYVLDKKINEESLATWETDILSLNKEIAAKIQNNQDICLSKIADIEAGRPVNIDEGWIIE